MTEGKPQITFPKTLQDQLEKIKIKVRAYKRTDDDEYQIQARKLYSELELLKIDFQNHIFNELRQSKTNDNGFVLDEKYLSDLDKQMTDIWENKKENVSGEKQPEDPNLPSPPSPSPSPSLAQEFEELRQHLIISRRGLLERFSLMILLKGIGLILYLVLSFPIFFPLSIVRVIHPLFLFLFKVNNNNLPGDHLVRYYTAGFLTVLGTEVEVENASVLDLEQPTIGMFSHSSNYDSFIVSAHSPISFKWIGKTSIFWIPFLGWMGWATGMIPLDRSNIQSAIVSLDRAAHRAKIGRRSIAISPEGTRSKIGLLGDFKKGPFHLTKKTELTMTPILIFGAFELYPPKQILPSPGKVVLRFLAPMTYDRKSSLIENSLKVRQVMVQELGKFPEQKLKQRVTNADLKAYLFISFLFLITAFLVQSFC